MEERRPTRLQAPSGRRETAPPRVPRALRDRPQRRALPTAGSAAALGPGHRPVGVSAGLLRRSHPLPGEPRLPTGRRTPHGIRMSRESSRPAQRPHGPQPQDRPARVDQCPWDDSTRNPNDRTRAAATHRPMRRPTAPRALGPEPWALRPVPCALRFFFHYSIWASSPGALLPRFDDSARGNGTAWAVRPGGIRVPRMSMDSSSGRVE